MIYASDFMFVVVTEHPEGVIEDPEGMTIVMIAATKG